MDGLVSNISLIAGVAGGGVSARTVLLTGVAGWIAGAISMALGEFSSVRTQTEQVEAELAKERRELRLNPVAEHHELVAMLSARGFSDTLAKQVADEISADPELALRVHAQEELGVVPDQQPSPWVAAGSSFLCFSLGALVPLLPYFFGFSVFWPALVCGALGLFVAGALASRATSKRWWMGGGRQLLLGMAAAGVTFVVGRVIGVNVN
ncbi:MAG: hypothetical protein HOQ05_05260 [Corynebacteriales bacterium]|nr:hypothetical protein [Mycobacteriales bacterium]